MIKLKLSLAAMLTYTVVVWVGKKKGRKGEGIEKREGKERGKRREDKGEREREK